MKTEEKEKPVSVCYRIRPTVRAWLSAEADQKHDRPANWLVNKLLEDAYAKSQQTQGAAA